MGPFQDPSGEGGHTPACGKGVVGANSDEGTDTIYGTLYTNPFSLIQTVHVPQVEVLQQADDPLPI